MAWKALHGALGALADPAQLSAAAYCEYGRLDDCRDRSPAMARQRTAPHVRGSFEAIGAGTSLFTLLGFLGRYTVRFIFWIVPVYTTIQKGPSPAVERVPAIHLRQHRRKAHGHTLVLDRGCYVTAYVVLDGFDLGVGIVFPFVARTEEEHQHALRAIGPAWDGMRSGCWPLVEPSSSLFLFSTPPPSAALTAAHDRVRLSF